MNNDVTLRVNQKEWGGWTSVSISAGIERLARDFTVEITRQWPGCDHSGHMQPQIKKGDSVTVLIGTDEVMTGYIDAVPIRYDASSVSVGITGRGKTADLIDCSAKMMQFSGCSLVHIVTELAKPFGINVVNAGIATKPLQGVQVDYGETVVDVINKLMKIQPVLAYDNPKGELVLGPIGATKAVTELVLGQNILTCNSGQRFDHRFSEYIVAGQRAGNNVDFCTPTIHAISAKSVDPQVTRYRPLVIKQSGNSTGASVRERGRFEMLRRIARTDEISYSVPGWRQGNGELWAANQLVSVHDPVFGFTNKEMLIAEVTYKKDDQGTITELRMAPPDAYLPESE